MWSVRAASTVAASAAATGVAVVVASVAAAAVVAAPTAVAVAAPTVAVVAVMAVVAAAVTDPRGGRPLGRCQQTPGTPWGFFVPVWAAGGQRGANVALTRPCKSATRERSS